jgi:hypothetical protein
MNAMPPRRRRYVVIVLAIITTLAILSRSTNYWGRWRAVPKMPNAGPQFGGSILQQELDTLEADAPGNRNMTFSTRFKPGVPNPRSNYTRTVVVPKMKSEDISWLDEELSDTPKAIYVVDDKKAPLHPPKNKGNEAMVYLSYIIDHYNKLPDISIFVHAHRWAWHNNDLLGTDTAIMIRHLSSARVIREGYMNLRCQWYPGCPGWLHPGSQQVDEEKKEEVLVGKAWKEIFPNEPIPEVLGQPCCSQFALSADRIRAIPLQEYKRLQQWLLKTKLTSSMSGRIFEYLWQYLWTGSPVVCPSTHECYCDGFGACFKNETNFQNWFKLRYYVRQDEWELLGWQMSELYFEDYIKRRSWKEAAQLARPPEGRVKELKDYIAERWFVLDNWKEIALEDGKDPRLRAEVAGRAWIEGDGF